MRVTLPAGHYKGLEKLVSQINTSMKLRMGVSLARQVPIGVSFVKSKSRVMMSICQNLCVQFSPVLARMLGFRHDVKYSGTSVLGERKMQLRSFVRSINVYCYLAEHVPVGDTKAPLLCIVNITSNDNESVHEIFNPV